MHLLPHAQFLGVSRLAFAVLLGTSTHIQMALMSVLLDHSPIALPQEVFLDVEWEGDPQEDLLALGMSLLRVLAARNRFWMRRMCQ